MGTTKSFRAAQLPSQGVTNEEGKGVQRQTRTSSINMNPSRSLVIFEQFDKETAH
jgi:hypothetical protein